MLSNSSPDSFIAGAIEPATGNQGVVQKDFNVVLYPSGSQQQVSYKGSRMEVQLK